MESMLRVTADAAVGTVYVKGGFSAQQAGQSAAQGKTQKSGEAVISLPACVK